MSRPRLLDLFCGAGGAAMGYSRAGFDVVGVDCNPQPNYPFQSRQENAMAFLDLDEGEWWQTFDVIHASPPCQAYSAAQTMRGREHPDLLPRVRELLNQTGLPWIIENVPGAPMRADFRLCGCQFDLGSGDGKLYRPRLFETNPALCALVPPCSGHSGRSIPVFGHNPNKDYYARWGKGSPIEERREAMGIDWMTRDELAQAIPPVFTEFVGRQMLQHHLKVPA